MKKSVFPGNVYGRLTVVSVETVEGKRYALCRCECGNQKNIRTSGLTTGRTLSCGCFRKEVTARTSYSHGETSNGELSPEYKIWAGMISRCRPGNKYYGDRGISVCDRWAGENGLQNFIADIGRRPSELYSIDRYPNTLGNYEPGNVRWATDEQQARNARSNRLVFINGSEITFAEAVERFGKVTYNTAMMRAFRGWPDVDAIVTPLEGRRP
jgi:hypothetical protein